MAGILSKFWGIFDLWGAHRTIVQQVGELEERRRIDDIKIRKLLTKATVDGDERWFLQIVKDDPTCAMRVIEECKKK